MSELEHSMSPHPQKVGELTNIFKLTLNIFKVTFKRPDTVDSYNDADVDDYSTQDDGGESTEPENSGRGGGTMYFGQMEERSDQYQVHTTLLSVGICLQ